MDPDCAILSGPQPWAPAQVGSLADCQRYLVCGANGLSVAHDADRPAALANGVWLFPALESPGRVGADQCVDVHKQTPGRKRHIVTDTLGLLLVVLVHRASLQDGPGGQQTLQRLFDRIKRHVHNRWCRLKLIWADGAYRHIVDSVRQQFGWTLDIVLRSEDVTGFQVLPRRWVVERTFGWLGRYRRLARDFEHTCLSSEAMTYIASIRRMLKLATK